jgi:hypothetical protein
VSVQRAAQARRIARIRCCLPFHSSFVQWSEDTMLPADADLRQFTAKPHCVVDTGGQRGRHACGRRVEISLRSEGDRWQWQCRLAWRLSPTACSTEGIRQGVGRFQRATRVSKWKVRIAWVARVKQMPCVVHRVPVVKGQVTWLWQQHSRCACPGRRDEIHGDQRGRVGQSGVPIATNPTSAFLNRK